MEANEIVLYFSLKYQGDWEKIFTAIKNKEAIDDDSFNKLVSSNKDNYITIIDDNYPNCFKNINKPPFVLYYKGDINLLNKEAKYLGIVGSRKNTNYGRDAVFKIIDGLNDDYVIISGLARGIDYYAHSGALHNKIKTIAVLGSGINNLYPNINKPISEKIINEGGLIISEYPYNTEIKPENFGIRNRIIAALSDFLLVAEAYHRSGTSITVNFALSSGKDVGCIPYEINKNSMCNKLIKDGAFLIENSEDIIEYFNNK
ncbi:MAG: DNA-processing protein DprA [Bacillales bacterium]